MEGFSGMEAAGNEVEEALVRQNMYSDGKA